MGMLHVSDYITIERPKVYVLKRWNFRYTPLGSSLYEHDKILGYFTSKDAATKYVQQLIHHRKMAAVNVGKNKFGDNIIHYALIGDDGIPELNNTFPIYIVEHEMDLDINESSFSKTIYPNIEPEITIKTKDES